MKMRILRNLHEKVERIDKKIFDLNREKTELQAEIIEEIANQMDGVRRLKK